MQLQFSQIDNIMVVEFPANVVYGNAEQIKNQLFALIDNGHANLSLLLDSVEYIDSSGLAVLVSVYKRAKTLGGKVCLIAPSENAMLLIELTRMNEIFNIYGDTQIAVEHMTAA